MPTDILDLTSTTHRIHTKLTNSKATVALVNRHSCFLEDFILTIKVQDAHRPRMWVEVDEKGSHASMVCSKSYFMHFILTLYSCHSTPNSTSKINSGRQR